MTCTLILKRQKSKAFHYKCNRCENDTPAKWPGARKQNFFKIILIKEVRLKNDLLIQFSVTLFIPILMRKSIMILISISSRVIFHTCYFLQVESNFAKYAARAAFFWSWPRKIGIKY